MKQECYPLDYDIWLVFVRCIVFCIWEMLR